MERTASEDREVDRKERMRHPGVDQEARPPEERLKDFEPFPS